MRGALSRWLPQAFPVRPEVEYLHADQRDAPEAVTGSGGVLRWQADLGPFGELRQEGGALGTMPLRLSGQYAAHGRLYGWQGMERDFPGRCSE